jgi:hypothetical protein
MPSKRETMQKKSDREMLRVVTVMRPTVCDAPSFSVMSCFVYLPGEQTEEKKIKRTIETREHAIIQTVLRRRLGHTALAR